jgi:hypothetical protein
MGRAVAWFGVWALVGAAWALALVGAASIGVFVLPVALVVTVLVARARGAEAGLPGVVAGLGLPLFYVALLNRAGPDPNHCNPAGTHCEELMSPWPWFALGAAFVLGGVALFAYRHRDASGRA